jgi:hypothetical protein
LVKEVTLEDHNAVIITSASVIFELQEYLTYRMYDGKIPEKSAKLNDITATLGIYLIILGIFMELTDQFLNRAE